MIAKSYHSSSSLSDKFSLDEERHYQTATNIEFTGSLYSVAPVDARGNDEDDGFFSGDSCTSLLDEPQVESYKVAFLQNETELQHEQSVKVLQRALRGFFKRREQKEANIFGYKLMSSSVDRRDRYYDTSKRFKNYCLRMPTTESAVAISGGFKKVIAVDSKYIALKPINGHIPVLLGKAENKRLRQLVKYSSLYPNFNVEHHRNIGINAGEQLFSSVIQQGNTVSIKQFKLMASDLAMMHKDGWLHRDIKTDNMGVNPKTGQLSMFDLSSIVKAADFKLKKIKPMGSMKFTTRELYLGTLRADDNIMRRQDNYALLLAMMEATDLKLAKAVAELPAMSSTAGIYHSENKDVIDLWLSQHVVPEYLAEIK